jgi:hypothetical protein
LKIAALPAGFCLGQKMGFKVRSNRSAALDLLFWGFPVLWCDAILATQVGLCSHFDARADGAQRCLSCLSTNSPPLGDALTSDKLCKGLWGVNDGL